MLDYVRNLLKLKLDSVTQKWMRNLQFFEAVLLHHSFCGLVLRVVIQRTKPCTQDEGESSELCLCFASLLGCRLARTRKGLSFYQLFVERLELTVATVRDG